MLDLNTPHVNYLSPDYFEPRKSIKSILGGKDPLLKAITEFVIENIEHYDKPLEYEWDNNMYGHSGNNIPFTLCDVLSRDRWMSDDNNKIALAIVNEIIYLCKQGITGDYNEFVSFQLLSTYEHETKKAIYALVAVLNDYARQGNEISYFNNPNIDISYEIYNYFRTKVIRQNILKFIKDSYFIVKVFYNNESMPASIGMVESAEDTSQEYTDIASNKDRLCLKVLVLMYNRLWSKLGMSECSNADKARFLAMVSGYKFDSIYNRLNENYDLTERDHKEDVDKANTFLLKMGIKKPITIKVKSKKM